ncbi:Hint domain-containing protein [Thermodesulfobacteriota bacterium]
MAVVVGMALTLAAGGLNQPQAEDGKTETGPTFAPAVSQIEVDKETLENWIKKYDDEITILYKEIDAKNNAIIELLMMGRDLNSESIIVREELSLILLYIKLCDERAKMKKALEALMESQGDDVGCFLPDTKVLMGDGTRREISRVSEGDMVQSYNIEKGVLEKKRVLKTYTFPSKGYYLINGSVKATGAHPFLMAGPGEIWKKASELGIGDNVKAADGRITIKSIEKVKDVNTAHNFLVADNRAYIVGKGDERYVVHNGL